MAHQAPPASGARAGDGRRAARNHHHHHSIIVYFRQTRDFPPACPRRSRVESGAPVPATWRRQPCGRGSTSLRSRRQGRFLSLSCLTQPNNPHPAQTLLLGLSSRLVSSPCNRGRREGQVKRGPPGVARGWKGSSPPHARRRLAAGAANAEPRGPARPPDSTCVLLATRMRGYVWKRWQASCLGQGGKASSGCKARGVAAVAREGGPR